jgi:Ca2+-binding RTX toxin-like protein
MRGRAMLAALVALLGLAVLAALFGVSRDGDGPVAELAAAGATCEGVPATILGTERNDTIEGTSGPDVIVAKGGSDVIRAYGGDDVVCGGPGSDRIVTGEGDDVSIGGTGNDWVTSVAGADRVVGGDGDETVDVRTRSGEPVTLLGGEGLDLLTLEVTGTEPVLLDQAEQLLILGPEPEHEPGAFGGWELVWLKGDHPWTYVGTDARDSVIAIGGSLSASTYGGNDVMSAGAGDDIINGGEGRRDVAAVIGGLNSCTATELGDCEETVDPLAIRPALTRQPRSAALAARTSA